MPSWLPSTPYPPPKVGYWLPVTSTLNWCEEDYYATSYAAEVVNTLTNLLFQWVAIRGIINCVRNGHDTIYLLTFIGCFVVGTGSMLFHATLKYPMQLVDELAMIYTTCLMFYATYSVLLEPTGRFLLGIGLLGLSVFITAYYHYLGDPVFHQVCYALLTIAVLFRAMYIMEVNLRPSRRKQQGHRGVSAAEQKRRDARDVRALTDMWWMVGLGIGSFLGAFAIWNLDNIFCSTLRRWRHQVGLPWGLLLEGHGHWHLLTGFGAYHYVVWGVYLRHCLMGRQDQYEVVWPHRIFSLPDIVKKDPAKAPKRKTAKKTA